MTETEKRRQRRERCAAKWAARSFAEEVRGNRTNTGVACAVGGDVVNVPAQKARRRVLWHAGDAARATMPEEKRAQLDNWRTAVR